MNRDELREAMQNRSLTLGEILKHAFGLLTDRFGSFFLLTLLIYVPISFILQMKMQQVDLTVEDIELLASQLMGVGLVQLILSLLEIVAILVSAVLMHNLIYGESRMPFGTAFYRGIRMWPRAVLTVALLMMGALICSMSLSMMLYMPGLMLLAMPLLLMMAVFYSMMQSFTCTVSALRGRIGMDNIRYVLFILKGTMGRALGFFTVILLLSSGVSLVFNYMLENMVYYIAQLQQLPWLPIVINVVFSTLISVLSIYGFIAGSLLFLNLEEKRRKELNEAAQQMRAV